MDTKTYLAATLAHMRLFTSVHTGVDSQSTALDELFTTTGVIAHMGSDTTVDTF